MRARVGLVGAGWWTQFVHLPALKANPDADVVVICDRDLSRAADAASRFDVAHGVADVADMIDAGIEAAIVATPHDAHHEPAATLLDAGVDVLVEKPMTLAPVEAWDLVRRAAASGANLHVGYTSAHSRLARSLRTELDDVLGDVVMVSGLFASAVERLYRGDVSGQQDEGAPVLPQPSTYADPKRGGGQLYAQLTHAVGLVLWLTGLTPVSVAAHGYAGDTAVDLADTLTVGLGNSGGPDAVAGFATTGGVHDGRHRIEEYRLFARGGHALLDTKAARLEIVRPGRDPRLETGHGGDLQAATSGALVATAIGQTPVVVPGEIGARTVDVLAAASQSIETGTVVPIPEDHHV